MRLRENIAGLFKRLDPSTVFAVRLLDGKQFSTTFVEAWRFRVSRAGDLIFYSWLGRRESIIRAGLWAIVQRDLSPDDLEEAGHEK